MKITDFYLGYVFYIKTNTYKPRNLLLPLRTTLKAVFWKEL